MILRSQRVPALVALVAATVLGLAGACGPKDDPARPSQCPTAGCEVPAPQDGDPGFRLYDCSDTGDKGPCGTLWPGTDGQCHWWQVNIGHTLDDGTAVDLGVWALDDGEECA